MSIWGSSGPDEGFAPFFLGGLLLTLSTGLIIKSILEGKEEYPDARGKIEKNRRRVYVYMTSILFYGTFLGILGYILTTALFLMVIIKIAEKQSYVLSLLVMLFTVIILIFLFKIFLQVPLPSGIMEYFWRL